MIWLPLDSAHEATRRATTAPWKGLPVQGLPWPAAPPLDRRPSVRTGRLRVAILAARRALVDRQQPDGHWVGELQGDTILESEWILLMAFLGRESDDRVRRA